MAKPQYIFLDYGAYEMVRSTCGAANAPWPARASERLHDGCRLRQSRHSGGETAARLGASRARPSKVRLAEVTKGTTQEVEASSSRSRSEAAKMRRDVIGRNAEKQEKGPGLGGTCS